MTKMASEHPTFQDGNVTRKVENGFYRGETVNFLPSDETYRHASVIGKYLVKGTVPDSPFVDKETNIVAFGSCFASHISKFLKDRGYNVATQKGGEAYVARMGAGIVNTFAVRQQFEWAWLNKFPQVELWHGYDAHALGYDEEVRLKTKALLDNADVFIITLGLAEIWYDEPTSEVFWRAVPKEYFDASRHKFRVSSVEENLNNLKAICQLIKEYRPNARIVFTLSPIPLMATFRDLSCCVANSVSKSILRVALDELMRSVDTDANIYYFPSYEIVLNCFNNPFLEDRRHVHKHILDFNMNVFERYFCCSDLTDKGLYNSFLKSQSLDRRVGKYGHWSVLNTLQDREFKQETPPFFIRAIKFFEYLKMKGSRLSRKKS